MEMLCIAHARLARATIVPVCRAGRSPSRRLSLQHLCLASHPRQSERTQLEHARQAVRDMVGEPRSPAAADWDQLAHTFRQFVPDASLDVIDRQTLLACRERRDLMPARALLRHRQGSHAMPVGNLTAFLELYTVCRGGSDTDALEVHRALSAQRLDRVSACRAVLGLCATRHWRLALAHLPDACENDQPSVAALTALAAAAFAASDAQLGWEQLDRLAGALLRPGDEALHAWLRHCQAAGHREARAQLDGGAAGGEVQPTGATAADLLLRLLRYLAQSEMILSEEVATRLLELCTSRLVDRWAAKATHVSSSGCCQNCGLVLPQAVLSDSDLAEIRQELEQRVLIGDDVFQTSSPQEVDRFRRLVARTAPYDVVVDGLNVCLACSRTKGQSLTKALVQVVDHFAVKEGKKVLVIGRYHMKGWDKRDMAYVKRHAVLFTADNMSADDPFLLYAVLHSHPGTQFVTRDLLRDHAARLSPGTRSKFNQLVRRNRVAVDMVTSHGNLHLTLPITHAVRAQCDPAGGWHVPFTDQPQPGNSTATPSPTRPVTDRWLCLRPTS